MIQVPRGFQIAVANAEFRERAEPRNDLALVISDAPVIAAAVFTTNLFKAAPVLLAQENLIHGGTRAILINSGQANACTGERGLQACLESQKMIEELFSLPEKSILTASTGVIGAHMDMQKWRKALPQLQASLGKANMEDFAKATMTTDAFPKFSGKTLSINGKDVHFAAVAKGAGMICPNMATMLSSVLTDAVVSQENWQEAFRYAVDQTFNRVSVDGDTSTNDTLFGLASGQSGVEVELETLKEVLVEVLGDVAYMLVKDGEGSTKVLHIDVIGAKSNADANAIARTVGHSQLVKTAMYGKDPNWGRIVAAAGRAGVDFDPNAIRVVLCGIEIFKNGEPTDIDIDALFLEPLTETNISLEIFLAEGEGKARLLCSDLSHDYVTCNADYRT